MSLFKVTLKQGQQTRTAIVEAASASNVLSLYAEVSTMKVSEIARIEYQSSDSAIPVDDFNYHKYYKGYVKNEDTNFSRQVILHNIKISKSERDVSQALKAYTLVGDVPIDSVFSAVMKVH